jgi:hypothetical protein
MLTHGGSVAAVSGCASISDAVFSDTPYFTNTVTPDWLDAAPNFTWMVTAPEPSPDGTNAFT